MKKFLFIPVFVSLFACGNGQQTGAPTEESNAVESVSKLAEMKQASIEYMAKLDTTPTIKGIKEEEVLTLRMNMVAALMLNGLITDISNATDMLNELNPTYIVLKLDKNAPKDSVDALVNGVYTYYKGNASNESPKYFFFQQLDYCNANDGERRYEDLSTEFLLPPHRSIEEPKPYIPDSVISE